MIHEIHLEGFKSFLDQYIETKELTMLTGEQFREEYYNTGCDHDRETAFLK